MTERESSPLPHVETVDLNQVLLEDIIDPAHYRRWHRLAEENPEFAQELLLRAEHIAKTVTNQPEVAKGAIDLATFAIEVLRAATEREHREPSGGADDADPLPSA